jgi:hypothetical protein
MSARPESIDLVVKAYKRELQNTFPTKILFWSSPAEAPWMVGPSDTDSFDHNFFTPCLGLVRMLRCMPPIYKR